METNSMTTGALADSTYKTTNTSSNYSSASSASGTGKFGELGKNDFLALLVAQLRYQDPLNPMEDKEFIGQLTQFSTLEQITNMSSNFERFLENQQSQNIASASNMIGKDVRDISGNGGVVTGISFEQDGMYLLIGDSKIALGDVRKINNPS